MFIMLDGIDGSGKSTALNAWKKYLEEQGKAIFDLREYWQTNNGDYPNFEKLVAFDFIISCEPTYSLMGKTIRTELIRSATNYPPLAIAEAYSLDRLILYKKIIIPALKAGKHILQDRGVSSSLCYQPLSDHNLNLEVLRKLPGNALALEFKPDHLILITIDPKIALERLASRAHKNDQAIFEKLNFQTKVANLFASPEYAKMFSSLGTKIHYLPTEDKIDIMRGKATVLLKQLL